MQFQSYFAKNIQRGQTQNKRTLINAERILLPAKSELLELHMDQELQTVIYLMVMGKIIFGQRPELQPLSVVLM